MILHQTVRDGRTFQTALGMMSPSTGYEVCTSCTHPNGEVRTIGQPQAVAVASAYAVLAQFCPALLNEELVEDFYAGEVVGVSMTNGGMAVILQHSGNAG